MPSLPELRMIPVDRIDVLNPRTRARQSFEEIARNISDVGLKKPITVTLKKQGGEERYTLVCGQGRLESYRELGQDLIPALIDTGDDHDSMIKSLVENCARRRRSAVELFADIDDMKKHGYAIKEIAQKTGLNYYYVRDILQLFERGEARLLRAVYAGTLPISIACAIASCSEKGLQEVLQKAYDENLLRGSRLLAARKLIDHRRNYGKGGSIARKGREAVSPKDLLKTYRQEAERKKVIVRKAASTRDNLIFVTEAFRNLAADDNFSNLLRAEGLATMPRNLSARLDTARAHS